MSNTTSATDHGLPPDVHHVQATEYHTALFKTTGLRSRIDPSDLENDEIGFSVILDGPYLGLNAGTVGDEGDSLHIYQTLDPDQARELADALHEAADMAEEAREYEPEPDESPDGWLRRLIG